MDNNLTHREKWMKRMVEKHGSEEAVSLFMRQNGNKSKRNAVGSGGFAYLRKHDPERLKEISKQGGKAGGKTRDIGQG